MGGATASMPDGLRDAAWSGFIQWAHGFPDIRARFTADTGLSLERRTGIVALVDKATGFRDDVLKQFVEWATREIWGLEYAPKKYRDELEGKS